MLDDGQSIIGEFLIVEGDATPLLGKGYGRETGSSTSRCVSRDRFRRVPPQSGRSISKVVDWYRLSKGRGSETSHRQISTSSCSETQSCPFHQQQKVAKEIAKLEAADVIEKVSGPTEWVSRIVTPPKPKKPEEIRLCVDMRAANKAILRTRHVTPTLDELITQFNGATIFSKIDLRSGYHQLVLHPSSRYITTFWTHVGLYQYKRLSFGINAAAEVFQHDIQTVIQVVAGTINISDDIAIFGVDQCAHDKAPNEVLQKLQNAGREKKFPEEFRPSHYLVW